MKKSRFTEQQIAFATGLDGLQKDTDRPKEDRSCVDAIAGEVFDLTRLVDHHSFAYRAG